MNKHLDRTDTWTMNSVDIHDFGLDCRTSPENWIHILRHVNLAIKRGEVLGLVGESGCGKSSLAYNLLGYRAGNSRIASGSVEVGQIDMSHLGRAELDDVRGRKVALVPQNPTTALSPHLRIRSQLAEVIVRHGYATDTAPVEARLVELMQLVGLTDTDRILNSYPHELSGGQLQRIVIAMALSCDPQVLVLDEPTTGLDVTTQGQIIRLLGVLKHKIGLSMLYVTHDLNVLSQIADRVVVMYAGSIVETAPTAQLFAAPAHPYTRGLIGSIPNIRHRDRGRLRLNGILRRAELGEGCPFAPRCEHRRQDCDRRPPTTEQCAPRHEVACHFWRELPAIDLSPERIAAPSGAAAGAEEVLRVEELAISYKGRSFLSRLLGRTAPPVVRDVSLTLRRGEIVSLVGESGSGKSTIAKAITGMIDHVAGTIIYGGKVRLGNLRSRPAAVLREIQYVFQNPDESLNPRRSTGAALARVVGMFRKDLDAKARQQAVVRALREVQLDEGYVDRFPGQLSGGERQRVAIARGLVAEPRLLLCDEILSALDVSVQAKVIDVLMDLKQQGDLTMLFISHDLSVVRSISDRVVVLYKGMIMEEGPAEAIYQPPYHPYTHLLLNAVPEPGRLPQAAETQPNAATTNTVSCVFANRCQWKKGAICDSEAPPVIQAGELKIRCHHDAETLSGLATWHLADKTGEAPRLLA